MLGEELAEVEADLRTCRGAAGDDSASDTDRLHALGPRSLANVLEDYVDAALVGDAADLVSDLLAVMIDGVVGTELARFGKFVVVSSGSDDVGVEELCDLDGGGSDAGAGAENENPLSLLDLRACDQHVPGGEEDKRNAGGFIEAERVGNGDDVDFGDGDQFAITAIDAITQDRELAAEIVLAGGTHRTVITEHHGREQDSLSRPNRREVLADFFDGSGDVAAIDVGQVYARQAFANPEIEVVQGTGFHADQNLVLTELGVGNVAVLEDLRAAEFLKHDRFHGRLLGMRGKREKVSHRVCTRLKWYAGGLYNGGVLRIPRHLILLVLLLASTLCLAQNTAQTVLILPFENNSKAPGLEWISEAFPEVLGEGIGSSAIYIIPRDDRKLAFDRMGVPIGAHLSRETLYRISEQIDADYVVLGKYDYDGQTFTAAAQLLDMKKLYLAPEVKESGPLVNMVAIQRALAWDLLRTLAPESLPSKQDFLQSMPPIRLDAFENYVRGEVATTREEKIQRYLEAVRLNPRYTQAVLQLGKTYYANHEYESAASWFARVPATDSLAGQANFYRGLSCYYIGDYDCAETAFKFIAADMPLPEVVNNLGVVEGRRGKRSEIDYLEKAVNSDPNDPDYHFNLAVAYARVFDNARAIRELKSTLQLSPSDGEAKTFLDTLTGAPAPASGARPVSASAGKLPLQRIRRTYDETSYQQLALEIERAAEVRLSKEDPKRHADFHVDRGQQLLSQGFYVDAGKAFEEAITLDPTNAAAHAGLAQAYAATGKDQEAVAEASAALKLQPSAGAYLLLARQNLKDNKLSAASEEVDRALDLDPHNQDAQNLKHDIDAKLAGSRN